MKVLHINSNYLTTALHQTMIEHLDALDICGTVMAPTYDLRRCVINPRENVVPLECFKKQDRYFFSMKQKKIICSINHSVQVGTYNLIHAYTLFTDGNSAYELSKKYGIPYVVAVRNTDLGFFRLRINLRRRGIEILENAAAVFFLAETTKDRVLGDYVPENKRAAILEKSFIIPNGIDDFWLDNRYYERNLEQAVNRLAHQKVNVVCVGQISKRKNMSTLQKALNLLRGEGWDIALTVVGKIVDRDEYKMVISDQHTKYFQPVPKEDLITHYRKADVFALPSISETFGLVYAEAMTQGLPVLYSRGQGFDGQFPDGEVGFAIEAQNPADIANKIKLAVENYSLLAENSLHMSGKFRWLDICEKYKEIYERIAGE